MLSIEELANDDGKAEVNYRGHKVTFDFKPGRYTGELARDAIRSAEIIAACVTSWNIEGADPKNVDDVEKLPAGLINAIYVQVRDLSTLADLGEVSATSPTG